MLWMDISRDWEDNNVVNSVVVGCDVDGLRSVSNDINDAKLWLGRHHRRFHDQTESRAIHQIGCRLTLLAGPKPYIPVERGQYASPATDHAIGLLNEHGSLTTHEIAAIIGSKYNTTFMTLKRAHAKGRIAKTKQDNAVRWSAA